MFNFIPTQLSDFLEKHNIKDYSYTPKSILGDNQIIKIFSYFSIFFIGMLSLALILEPLTKLPHILKIIFATGSIYAIKQVELSDSDPNSFANIFFDSFRKLLILALIVLASLGIVEFLEAILYKKTNITIFLLMHIIIFNALFFWQIKNFAFRVLSSTALVASIVAFIIEHVIKLLPSFSHSHLLPIILVGFTFAMLYIHFTKVHYKYTKYFALPCLVSMYFILSFAYYADLSIADLGKYLNSIVLHYTLAAATFCSAIALILRHDYYTDIMKNKYYLIALILITACVLGNAFIALLILTIIISYQYTDKLLFILSVAGFFFAVSEYYYSLELSLLYKSIILMLSGSALLTARVLIIKGTK